MNSTVIAPELDARLTHVYRPAKFYGRLQVFIIAFLLLFSGSLVVGAVFGNHPAAALLALVGSGMSGLGILPLLNWIGFRSQHVTFRPQGLAFRLPPPNISFLYPWRLKEESVPWSDIRAAHTKLRRSMNSVVHVVRTSGADVVFTTPQWQHADDIVAELQRRSGCTTSFEDIEAPAATNAAEATTLGERLMRGAGTVLLVSIILLDAFCLWALFFGEPQDRVAMVKGLLILSFAILPALSMRRYRRIRYTAPQTQ